MMSDAFKEWWSKCGPAGSNDRKRDACALYVGLVERAEGGLAYAVWS